VNQYIKLYQSMVQLAKEEGVRVYHGKRNLNMATIHSSSKPRWMHVSSRIKNTLFGAFMIGHELGHWDHQKKGYFPKHYNKHKNEFKNKPLPISLIRDVEWSATQFGRKQIEKRGFKLPKKTTTPYDKNLFNEIHMPWFIQYYNYIRIGKKAPEYFEDFHRLYDLAFREK
jgi:hypothetical protein